MANSVRDPRANDQDVVLRAINPTLDASAVGLVSLLSEADDLPCHLLRRRESVHR